MPTTVVRKCQSCGHIRSYPACPECDGSGVRPRKLEEGELAHTGFQFSQCGACEGTGIRDGKVIVQI